MDTGTYNRIKEMALHIERFRTLEESDQIWLRDLLRNGRAVLSCLEILDLIEDRPLNYYELATVLECSSETAKQRLNALILGGIAISEARDGRFKASRCGRPRKLCHKQQESFPD